MDSVSPVWTEAEVEWEQVIALDQKEYIPIVILSVQYADGDKGMAVRYRPTAAERRALAEGADLVITELTFGHQFTPINVTVCNPNERPFD